MKRVSLPGKFLIWVILTGLLVSVGVMVMFCYLFESGVDTMRLQQAQQQADFLAERIQKRLDDIHGTQDAFEAMGRDLWGGCPAVQEIVLLSRDMRVMASSNPDLVGKEYTGRKLADIRAVGASRRKLSFFMQNGEKLMDAIFPVRQRDRPLILMITMDRSLLPTLDAGQIYRQAGYLGLMVLLGYLVLFSGVHQGILHPLDKFVHFVLGASRGVLPSPQQLRSLTGRKDFDHAISQMVRDLASLKQLQETSTDMNILLEGRKHQLKEAEAKYRDLYHHAPCMYFSLDEEGRIIDCNQTMLDYLGFGSDELQGAPCYMLLHSEGVKNFMLGLRELKAKGANKQVMQWLKKDGTLIDVEVSARAVYDKEGNFLRTRSIAEDITQRRALETQVKVYTRGLERLNKELQQASQLKSAFLSSVSHELRTPINAILGYITLMLEDANNLTNQQMADMRRIKARAGELLQLIDGLLDLSKIEANRLELTYTHFPVAMILRDAENTIRPLAESKGLKFDVDAGDEDMMICTDAQRLRQIIVNLLSNAVKFTDAGHVRLSVQPRAQAGREGDAAHGTMLIKVEDTGIGIAPEHLEIVFDEFRQVDGSAARRAGGTGLGLAISRKLACLLGGDITVQSRLGVGSQFVLTLPIHDRRMKEAQKA